MVDPKISFIFTHITIKYSSHDHILQPKGVSHYFIVIFDPKIYLKNHFTIVVGGMFLRTRSYKDLQQEVINVFYNNIILLGRNGRSRPAPIVTYNCK
jgi:hypothetical protein